MLILNDFSYSFFNAYDKSVSHYNLDNGFYDVEVDLNVKSIIQLHNIVVDTISIIY